MTDDDLDLATLPDDELVEQMHDDLYDGMAEEIDQGTRILLDRGWSPQRTLNEALVEGMRIVGVDFRDGILFVPEVLLAANAMKAGMAILRPLLAETGAESVGKVVIGTVKGDIHDIGKNLVGMMLEGAGFEVIDIGINNDAGAYLDALEEHQPDILGMSALLTTTMPYMKVVIDEMVERGVRDHYIVLVGGAPVNEEFSVAVGADAYCRDAAVAAEMAKQMVQARHAGAAGAPPSRRPAHEPPSCTHADVRRHLVGRHPLPGDGPRRGAHPEGRAARPVPARDRPVRDGRWPGRVRLLPGGLDPDRARGHGRPAGPARGRGRRAGPTVPARGAGTTDRPPERTARVRDDRPATGEWHP